MSEEPTVPEGADPFEPKPVPTWVEGTLEEEKHLISRGWFKTRKGWRHPGFEWPWTLVDALELEDERDKGDDSARKLLGEPNE